VKRTVGHADFSGEEFGWHSLRAGLATSAALAGQHERDIMQQTRHKSEKTVRRVYPQRVFVPGQCRRCTWILGVDYVSSLN
jgi:integrase